MLPQLAQVFSVGVDELMGQQVKASRGKRGRVSVLEQQMQQIELLPKQKQKFVQQMLQTVLAQA